MIYSEVMELLLGIILAVVVAGFAILILRKPKEKSPDQSLLMLQNQVNEISRVLDSKLGESAKVMQQQFGQSARIIRDVTEKLTRLDETNKQVVGFADQLKSLQDILKNPKQRGILGEYYLETVLKNVLPPGAYQMQYSFKDGVIVDAAVFVGKQVIPVDSKFSLENYNRFLEARDDEGRRKHEVAFVNDLKNRIEETSKYVKPQENTTDFAFMFIPSEAVYYDLLINKVGSLAEDRNLLAHAAQKKVVVVSPTSFLAYLQTVLQGLRNQKISEQAQDIVKQVDNLGRHLIKYDDYMQRLGKNLGTSVSMYNSAYKEFAKIDKDVLKITGEAMEIEPQLIEKPAEVEELN